jgi:hypothetical protein
MTQEHSENLAQAPYFLKHAHETNARAQSGGETHPEIRHGSVSAMRFWPSLTSWTSFAGSFATVVPDAYAGETPG